MTPRSVYTLCMLPTHLLCTLIYILAEVRDRVSHVAGVALAREGSIGVRAPAIKISTRCVWWVSVITIFTLALVRTRCVSTVSIFSTDSFPVFTLVYIHTSTIIFYLEPFLADTCLTIPCIPPNRAVTPVTSFEILANTVLVTPVSPSTALVYILTRYPRRRSMVPCLAVTPVCSHIVGTLTILPTDRWG